MRQEQVVLVVLTVRRAAGLDLQHARVAVQVDEERRLDDAREVAHDAGLGRRARDHVAVDVESVGVRALSERPPVGIVRHGEVDAVVLQEVAHLGPRRRGEVLDVVQHRVGALPLVAVDVRVEPDRHLVLVHERRVPRRCIGVGLDELPPGSLLGGLRLGLLGRQGDEVDVAPERRLAHDLRRDAVALRHEGVQERRDLVVRGDPSRDRGVGRIVGHRRQQRLRRVARGRGNERGDRRGDRRGGEALECGRRRRADDERRGGDRCDARPGEESMERHGAPFHSVRIRGTGTAAVRVRTADAADGAGL